MGTTIIQMFKISQNKWISIALLLVVIIISLVISKMFPCFTRYISKEGFKEGLMDQSEIDKVKGILETYVKTTEQICTEGINNLTNKLPKFNLASSEQLVIQPLLEDKTRTSKYKVDQISQLNTTNTQLTSFIAEVNGKIYTANTVMLNAIYALNITDDTTFAGLIKQQRATPTITDSTATESTYTAIKNYLEASSNIPK